MAKVDFYSMDMAEKVAIFDAIASDTGMTPFAVEKDWWVSRTLEIIFQMDIARHLVFKGGTSLSKAWKLIQRFSEDVDLAIDKEFFPGYSGELSKSKITRLRKEAGVYTTGTFFEELKKEFSKKGFNELHFNVVSTGESDQDPRILEIHYPNIIESPTKYIKPRIQIEVSCRSLREPFTLQIFGALVDEVYADREFAAPLFHVPTVVLERTFLEKIFLLHEEFHRPIGKMRVDRLSRHLYDIFHLTKSGIAEKAINDKMLYETIVTHRYKFSRVGGVDYNQLSPAGIDFIPIPEVLEAWREDYQAMKEEMIYEKDPPSFDDLMEILQSLKSRINALPWGLDKKFSKPGN